MSLKQRHEVEDTQEFEAKKDVVLEGIGIFLVLLMAAIIGALLVMTAGNETEQSNERDVESRSSR